MTEIKKEAINLIEEMPDWPYFCVWYHIYQYGI